MSAPDTPASSLAHHEFSLLPSCLKPRPPSISEGPPVLQRDPLSDKSRAMGLGVVIGVTARPTRPSSVQQQRGCLLGVFEPGVGVSNARVPLGNGGTRERP